MTAVLISIKSEWCKKILKGEKTLEIRKNRPKIKTPFKCYVYETKGRLMKRERFSAPWNDNELSDFNSYEGRGKVIGEFICDEIRKFEVLKSGAILNRNYIEFYKTCLTMEEAAEYIGKGKKGYAWQISNLKIYDRPKELYEFCNMDICPYGIARCKECDYNIKRAPQSWCYVNDYVAVDF